MYAVMSNSVPGLRPPGSCAGIDRTLLNTLNTLAHRCRRVAPPPIGHGRYPPPNIDPFLPIASSAAVNFPSGFVVWQVLQLPRKYPSPRLACASALKRPVDTSLTAI